jgi:competence ComEA-like helix-hairpin-helix protein
MGRSIKSKSRAGAFSELLNWKERAFSIFHMRFDICHCPEIAQCSFSVEYRWFPATANVKSYATIVASFLFILTLISTASPAASISYSQSEERIDINAASVEELERLPGIGSALASRIVEHRRKHGLFKRTQDVIIVRGMSAKLYRRIAHLIRV